MAGRAGRVVLGIVVAALAGCGEEPIPENVTFEPTIRAVFAAHCVRCHGAGGTLNIDPDPRVFGGTDYPGTYLNQLEDSGDCTVDPVTMALPASCKHGARYAAPTIRLYTVMAKDTDAMRMPPAPSDPLNDREKKLVAKWCENPQ